MFQTILNLTIATTVLVCTFESEYYHDIDLNGFSITDAGDFDGFVVNESKTIELVQPDTYRTVKLGISRRLITCQAILNTQMLTR